ncbi:hypothetical protein O181_025936 [Austropuccinia psidii MF-1]|uniref:RlpA-like protein double-psi beta-barrel domain-containing protein n=1 Tax=Austropuccinia psidii MF-1 TaxID=1389203 RepID=A0A9Q3H015_9BASI|nr:hypothetical protein [Austropuccinia psidii MF-1]
MVAKISLEVLLFLLPIVLASDNKPNKKLQKRRSSFASNAPSGQWVSLETHGLMLAHKPTPSRYLDELKPVPSKDNDISLFSSSLHGLSSSPESFVNWDDELVHELSEASWSKRPTSQSFGSHDVVRRSGYLQLTKTAKGLNDLDLSISKNTISNHIPSVAAARSKRMVRHASHVKRSSKKHSAGVEALINHSPASIDMIKGATIPVVITWYTGHDLLNPYCAQRSKWTPTDNSLVIAVTQVWSNRPQCGDFFELKVKGKHTGQTGVSVIARVVDLCGGCPPEVPHADLSKAAFTRLFNLDVGLASGLAMRKVSPPKKWNDALYGPRLL